MGSRYTGNDVEKIYAIAELWVERALKSDGSLFMPGQPIWSSQWLNELHERFLNHPDPGSGSFTEKLQRQLDGSPTEVYQLMGEVLHIHLLIVWQGMMRTVTKKNLINEVLGWAPAPLAVPDYMVDYFASGIANPGMGFATYRPYQVGFLIEFVEQWKSKSAGEQDHLLEDPWAFKDFAMGAPLNSLLLRNNQNTPRTQRHALLHLVYPDTFEGIVSAEHKRRISEAEAFTDYVRNDTADTDRKIQQIRQGIEAAKRSGFNTFYDADIHRMWDSSVPSPTKPVDPPPPGPDLQALSEELTFPVKFLEDVQTLLGDKKQVIFQGPPGTGKTYVAQKFAECLAGSKDRVTLVQFHPSYAYEDFVQGFRPILKDGQPGFALRDGPLLQAAEQARNDSDGKQHFLIIDEINRGNLAKILGELYFLLEYRDEEISLQYSDKRFSLPDNLYIIGTMNTADRSIALVDMALRRRFYFVEFHPDRWPIKGLLRLWLEENAPDMEWIAGVVDLANERLGEDRHAAIGPSYFMKPGLDETTARRAWEHGVLPYIEERLFGQDDRLGEFDLDKLRDAGSTVSEAGDGDQNQDEDAQ